MPGTRTSTVRSGPRSAPPGSGLPAPAEVGRPALLRRAAAGLVLAAALGGCSGSDAPVVSATDVTASPPPSVTATAGPSPSAPTASELPATTSAAPTATPTSTAPAPGTTATTAPGPQPTTATPTTPDDAAAPRTQWPPALGEPAQGDPVWAVYLATGHSSQDAAIDQAVSDAAAVGYDAVVGDLACDQGALDALQLDPQDFWTAATLYFATEREVNAFLASYRARVGEVEGYAEVSLGCLD